MCAVYFLCPPPVDGHHVPYVFLPIPLSLRCTTIYRLDQRIDAKIEQVMSLRNLAAKATSTLSDAMPSGTRNIHRMEDIIMRIFDLENEINADIDALVALKREIVSTIKSVPNLEYQILLELRYLCFKPWEQIAVEMGYGIDNVFRLHQKALKDLEVGEKCTVKSIEIQ